MSTLIHLLELLGVLVVDVVLTALVLLTLLVSWSMLASLPGVARRTARRRSLRWRIGWTYHHTLIRLHWCGALAVLRGSLQRPLITPHRTSASSARSDERVPEGRS